MTKQQVIRAWTDRAYRDSLTPEQRAQLPEHPAGSPELSTEEVAAVAGGMRPLTIVTKGCCWGSL